MYKCNLTTDYIKLLMIQLRFHDAENILAFLCIALHYIWVHNRCIKLHLCKHDTMTLHGRA